MKKRLLALLAILFFINLILVQDSNSYFAKTSSISSNSLTISAEYWDPKLDFYLRSDKKAVGFTISNITDYQTLKYEITYYPTNRGPQGIIGIINLSGQNELTRENFLLGTNSSGIWVWDKGMDTISIKVTLTNSSSETNILESQIDY